MSGKLKRTPTGGMAAGVALGLLSLTLAVIAAPKRSTGPAHTTNWPTYGGPPGNTHYSDLKQINTTNVSRLKVAWSFDTGEVGGLETQPVVIDGVLYAFTPTKEVIALNAATGSLLWKFQSGIKAARPARGVSFWTDGHSKRILAGISNFLYELDADTGKVVPSFGDNGRIDLHENLRGEGYIELTSPGVVYKDLIIVGGAEPESLPAPAGDIRAYEIRTGKRAWTFHTIPHPGEFGYDTWPKDAWTRAGAANNWTGMTLDIERGIVYVPTGSAAPDWYGGERLGDDLFANSLIALKADTGERLWHFQGVHHDIWDRDFPAPPTLVTVRRDGKDVPAIAQTSKQGYLYVFNRLDGTPLFPIEYHSYPASTVPGEVTAREQGLPTKPLPFSRQRLTEDLLTTRTPEAHQWALEHFRTFISNGQFIPASLGKETVMFPGWVGGGEYGGAAVDPETHILYVNANDDALTTGLVKTAGGVGGHALYASQCAACHGGDRAGSPPSIPSLIDVGQRLTPAEILDVLEHGRGRMPSFAALPIAQREGITKFLLHSEDEEAASSSTSTYNTTGYHMFVDPEGYPAVATPWGTLNAINLDTGDYVWKIPFGDYPELAAKGVKNTGSESFGGPVITAGGLVIIAATAFDRKMRIFDKANGKLLWETTLPFSAIATPATYQVNGRQFIVIASGGGRDRRAKTGGVYVAFTLSP